MKKDTIFSDNDTLVISVKNKSRISANSDLARVFALRGDVIEIDFFLKIFY